MNFMVMNFVVTNGSFSPLQCSSRRRSFPSGCSVKAVKAETQRREDAKENFNKKE
jgi:hypothetical protein